MSGGSAPVLDLLEDEIVPGTTVIEASAGTGKTYTLTGWVLRLILEKRLPTARLLVVTFTHAATEELGGRIRAALRDAHALFTDHLETEDPFLLGLKRRHGGPEGAELLRRALLDYDELTVATIHGFCKRVLDESAFESGLPFEVEFLDNDDALLTESIRDVWRRLAGSGRPLFAAWVSHRGLHPDGFVKDYRLWRRHPRTRILPTPQPLEETLAHLEETRRELAERFDRPRLRMALTRLRIREDLELGSPERLKTVLAAAEAFVRGGPEGLWALELLRPEALKQMVSDGRDQELERLPGIPQVGALFAAFERFEHALRCEVLDRAHELFLERKERGARLAFDDLLHRLHRALQHPRHGPRLRRAVASRFRAALIDEFQDTDLVQYEIFRGLFREVPLVLVGDPKQAIYGFRGADIFAYLLARRDARKTYTLGRNWRSSQPLVTAVNALFGESPHPFVFDQIPFQPVTAAEVSAGRDLVGDGGKAMEWMWLPQESRRDRAEAAIHDHVAEEIVRLLSSGLELLEPDGSRAPLEPGHIAVLVRTNAQATAMQETLRRAGVPAVVGRSGDIFQADEMEELVRILEAVLDPARGERLRAACATLAWGSDATEIHRLQQDDAAFQRLVDRFDDYRRAWQERGFIAMMQRLLDEQRIAERLLGLANGERRLTNLQHAVEMLHQAIHDRGLGPAALVAWARLEGEAQEHDRDVAELRLESDSRAVSLVTVHKSKGLEYEVVFCPFLWLTRAPGKPPVSAHVTPDQVVFDCGSDRLSHHLSLATAEHLAEDLRLAYVALTRARRRCYVVWGDIGRAGASGRSALAYLLHRRQGTLPQELGDDSPEAVARRLAAEVEALRGRRDSWLDDLKDLVHRHDESMGLRILDEAADGSRRRLAAEDEDELLPRELPREAWSRAIPWRISSFTSMVRDGAREQPDHGDPDLPDLAGGRRLGERPEGIFAFARGPRAGDCLHRMLEQIDFTDFSSSNGPSEKSLEVVRRALEGSRLHLPEAHPQADGQSFEPETAVVHMLAAVLAAPLPGAGFSLGRVSRDRRLVEWQFYTPLESLAPVEFSDLLRAHGRGRWVEPYAERLAAMTRGHLRGFLTGFVDLLFEHGGRWYLVDWKSNHLGNRVEDYGAEALERTMIEHHYLLQYHLYTVAAHRYLASRLPDWNYERDFGGVFYVFLRGVPPANAALAPEGSELARSVPEPSAIDPIPGRAAGPSSRPAPLPAGQLSLFGPPEPAPPEPAPPESVPATPPTAALPVAPLPATGIFADRPPEALIRSLSRRIDGGGDP